MFNDSFGGHFLDECIFSCELLALHMVGFCHYFVLPSCYSSFGRRTIYAYVTEVVFHSISLTFRKSGRPAILLWRYLASAIGD